MMLNKIYTLFTLLLLLTSCKKKENPNNKESKWVYEKTIKVTGVNPIGIVPDEEDFWLSDGDHNRLVLINKEGLILKQIEGLDRPMHIDKSNNLLYVPEYGNDRISVLTNVGRDSLTVKDSLDAPAGISVVNNEKAIVDFYNHQIVYSNGAKWISFGKEGKAKGYFYFPTDVQIMPDEIFVADAYNNRIQVFDKKGNFLRVIGADEKMNAATGMYVSNDELFVTDFENNRILIFSLEGTLKQELKGHVNNPIDAIVAGKKLYVNNFREQSISVFARN